MTTLTFEERLAEVEHHIEVLMKINETQNQSIKHLMESIGIMAKTDRDLLEALKLLRPAEKP